jgi:membrane protein YdbS with pleckstrin-like domain
VTERELRRTALIIPPRGRAVLCCWAAIPGLLAAPFVFWQSLPAGVMFCLLWAALVAVVYQRACSYAAALGAETLTVYSGIVFPRAVRRRAVTGLFRLRTPLLRLAGVSVVVITAPGTRLILPAVPAEQAAALAHALAEEIR